MAGTAIGVVLGAVLIELVGGQTALLWALMPVLIFAAAYVPRVASFTAGQAVLTMMVLIAYNLIMPIGWRPGCCGSKTSGQARWSRSSRRCCCGRAAPPPRCTG